MLVAAMSDVQRIVYLAATAQDVNIGKRDRVAFEGYGRNL
jgi:hypothetical protein